MRLTAPSCASLWVKGRSLPSKSMESAVKCKGCAIGAANAGMPSELSRQIDATDQTCCRCHRAALKLLLGERLCVSCYNRQLEVLAGRNARGNVPVRHLPLIDCTASVCTATGPPRTERVKNATCTSEALLAITRAHKSETLITWDGHRLLLMD
jgi:hypothetical protein